MIITDPQNNAMFHNDPGVDLVAIPFERIENKTDRKVYLRCVNTSFILGRKSLEMACPAVEEVGLYHLV